MTSGLVLLDSAAVRRLIKTIGCDNDFLVYLGEWLTHLNVFSDAQVYGILNFAKSVICEFDRSAQTGLIPVATLGVADSRWVSLTGQDRFLDAETLEEIAELPQRAVTHIICDLTALWARMHYRQGREHERSQQPTAGPADQTGQQSDKLGSPESDPAGVASG